MKAKLTLERNAEKWSSTCRLCETRLEVTSNVFCDAAAETLLDLKILWHIVSRHWREITPRDRRYTARLAPKLIIFFILFEVLDLLHALLLGITFPFWWLREEVL